MRGSSWHEEGVVFNRDGSRLVGIAALPQVHQGVAVLLLVGGPQYRVGSHRQFTLLARDLAESGIPSLRFDYTGMGDSEGEQCDFSDVEGDITAALHALQAQDASIQRVVLWGLCDAASSAMMFAHRLPQVCGLVLLNPWVHGVDYSPQVKLSHYYRSISTGGDKWKRLFSGKVDVWTALREFVVSSLRTLAGTLGLRAGEGSRHSFVEKMHSGFSRFERDSLVILSEEDLTAQEFVALVENDRSWRQLMERPQVTRHTIRGADHTFSGKDWRGQVSRMTSDWIKQR